MFELRQRASNIGKLQVPLPGQMGSYSYRSTPQPSSNNSFISRSSNYTYSDMSSYTAKRNCSDIEEEEDSHIKSLDSNITSETKKFADVKVAADSRSVMFQLVSLKLNTKFYFVRFDNKFAQVNLSDQLACTDSLSWTELSSISSAIISTKSESNKSRIGSHVAQRDYRLQTYKCPENFVLPELTNQNVKNNLISDIITGKKSVAEWNTNAIKADDNNANKWSSVSEELQNNRLFVSEQIIYACSKFN